MAPENPWPGRGGQLRQLSLLLGESLPSPANLVLYGPDATGKSSVIKHHLETSDLPHAIVNCKETVTGRHLLETAIQACNRATSSALTNGLKAAATKPVPCESINAFAVELQRSLKSTSKFALVFDSIDQQHEPQPTLIPALARMGKLIPGLTLVFIITHPTPRHLAVPGAAHIYFPPYDRDQSVAILAMNPPHIFPKVDDTTELTPEAKEEDLYVWVRFCQAIWDSLGSGAARDLASFHEVTHRLWRPFVQPIVDGPFGTRDFSRLITAQRRLFQEEGGLADDLLDDGSGEVKHSEEGQDLPYYSKWILCAACLASFNPARLDPIHFMRTADRKKRKKGGNAAAGRAAKHRKIPRHLLSPSAFSIARLFAIMRAILPHELLSNVDLYTQLATLGSLRLLLRSGTLSSDAMEPGGKWRVNFGWETVNRMAREIEFDLMDHLAE